MGARPSNLRPRCARAERAKRRGGGRERKGRKKEELKIKKKEKGANKAQDKFSTYPGIKDLLARVKADKEEAKKRIEYYHDPAIGRFNQ
jgi:hypothetical protein